MIKKATIVIVFFIAHIGAKATHIIGGEMSYVCLGNNNYTITLKVYRDCFNGVPELDNPAVIGIFDVQGSLVQTLYAFDPVVTNIPPVINNPCLGIPPSVCVQEGVYTINATLPPINGGYMLVYQRCCRNNSILNIVSPEATGATYTAFIPGPGAVQCNSSPRYNNFPPIALCAGEPLVFDHSAFDPDGDSLVYSFCDPFEGASDTDPAPDPPAAPPYNNVIFSGPYSATYPLSSSPPLSINPQTGLLTGTPNQIGQYVVCICVSEYRNGQLITVHKRDFQFNVVNCLSNVLAAFINPNPDPLNSCNGFTIQFTNESVASSFYNWDFGDNTTLADTSSLVNPTYTYPTPGQYTVRLIANPGYICADTSFITFGVYPELVAEFTPPQGQCITGNSYSFTAGGIFQSNTQFNWNFGPNANPPTANTQNPQNISYTAPGTYGVTVTYTGQGCVRSYTDSVIVYPLPTIGLAIDDGSGCEPYGLYFNNTSTQSGSPLQFLWDFGDGFTSGEASPFHIYPNAGLYDVTLTAYSLAGCIDTLVLFEPNFIIVSPSPTAAITASPLVTDVLNPAVTVTNIAEGALSCQLYWGIGDTIFGCQQTYNYIYADSGTYNITQVVINEYGCPDTAVVPVRIKPIVSLYAPSAFTPNGDGTNDGFRIYGEGIKDFELLIYTRWGQKVFQSNNIFEEWNGTLFNKGGAVAADGVFVYTVYYTSVFGDKKSQRGKVVLIRGEQSAVGN